MITAAVAAAGLDRATALVDVVGLSDETPYDSDAQRRVWSRSGESAHE